MLVLLIGIDKQSGDRFSICSSRNSAWFLAIEAIIGILSLGELYLPPAKAAP